MGKEKVVVPERPTFDKIAALYIYMSVNEIKHIEGLKAYAVSDPEDSIIEKLIEEGHYALDVGKNKYQHRGTGSAVATVCQDFKVSDPLFLKLAEVATKNNKTGYLKSFPHSIVYLLREAYKIGIEETEVIQHVFIALDAHVASSKSPQRKWEEAPEELQELFQRLGGQSHPFTLARFVREAWVAGFAAEDIKKEVEWWIINVEAPAKETQVQARKEAEKINRIEFTFLGNLTGCWVETNNSMVARSLWEQGYNLVVVKKSSGNAAILTRKGNLDVSKLAEALNTLDHKRQGKEVWVYDPDIQACLNGSDSWHMPPTKLSQLEIIELIRTHVTRASRRRPA